MIKGMRGAENPGKWKTRMYNLRKERERSVLDY